MHSDGRIKRQKLGCEWFNKFQIAGQFHLAARGHAQGVLVTLENANTQIGFSPAVTVNEKAGYWRRVKASGFCQVQSGQPGCAGKFPRDARQRPWVR